MQPSEDPFTAEYTPFESLPVPVLPSSPKEFFDGMKMLFEEKSSWKHQLSAITLLRQINKFYPQESSNLMLAFWNYIEAYLQHARPVLSKSSLMYMQEVTAGGALSIDLLLKIEPLLAKESFSDKIFLRTEARKAYEFLIEKNRGEPLLYSLAKTGLEGKGSVEDLAMRTLDGCVAAVGQGVSQLSAVTFKMIFEAVKKCIMRKGESYKSCFNILKALWGFLGNENFAKLVGLLKEGGVLGEADVSRMQRMFNGEEPSDRKLMAARVAIREQKERARAFN